MRSIRAHMAKVKKHMTKASARHAATARGFAADPRAMLHRRYNIEVKRDRTAAGRVSRRKTYGLRVCIRRNLKGSRTGSASAEGTGRSRTEFILTWDAMANLAFEKHASRSTLARMYQVSERTAGRVNIYVAACGMQTQLEKLKKLQAAFDMFPPEWIICDVMRDETAERLSLNALAGSSSAQQASTWEVLVSRITLTWSFGRTIFHTEFIMPPVGCSRTTSTSRSRRS